MIGGINRVSYIDYPGEISTIIFTKGCNFRCGWCHNGGLLNPSPEFDTKNVLDDLLINQRNINHVVISGGEPTIHSQQLIDFIRKLKKYRFNVKLDTNGSNPDIIKKLLSERLLDFIAMDIKNTFNDYEQTIGTKVNIDQIKESINLIENSGLDYQFRITVNDLQHDQVKIDEIKSYLRIAGSLKIQNYKYSDQQIHNIDYQTIDIK